MAQQIYCFDPFVWFPRRVPLDSCVTVVGAGPWQELSHLELKLFTLVPNSFSINNNKLYLHDYIEIW